MTFVLRLTMPLVMPIAMPVFMVFVFVTGMRVVAVIVTRENERSDANATCVTR